MKTINQLIYLSITLLILGCNSSDSITNPSDYVIFLYQEDNVELQKAQVELDFWSDKLEKNPTQFPYLLKIAAAESQLFQYTGNIDYLINQATRLQTANDRTNYTNSGYLRALARNYISQHKFKEALELLLKAEKNSENLIATQKMLFDVHLELGNTKQALSYLSSYKNFTDFDYLIRLSKWSDHNGNLDSAISLMEKAVKISENNKTDDLTQWAYTNLADYYGHAGKIKQSYTYYLKALALDPNDSYALKGIAWIVYSHEKNPEQALKIINQITKKHNSPDYFLFKAEIAEYMEDPSEKNKNLEFYFSEIKKEKYGDMYNKYNTLLYSEELKNPDLAVQIALKEVGNRPTVQSYDLLAWSYFNQGNMDSALEIAKSKLANKTTEPEVLYHLAVIYKADKQMDKVAELKKELLTASYELGPVMANKIRKL